MRPRIEGASSAISEDRRRKPKRDAQPSSATTSLVPAELEKGAQGLRQMALQIGQQPPNLAGLLHQGLEQFMSRQPMRQQRRDVDAPPTVPGGERHILELAEPRGKPALHGFVIPDDPDPSRRWNVVKPGQPNLLGIGSEDFVEAIQGPAPLRLIAWAGEPRSPQRHRRP